MERTQQSRAAGGLRARVKVMMRTGWSLNKGCDRLGFPGLLAF